MADHLSDDLDFIGNGFMSRKGAKVIPLASLRPCVRFLDQLDLVWSCRQKLQRMQTGTD
jgi:hypothetical protein